MATTDEPTSFGSLLRKYRIVAGLTQADLAERAGLSVRGISDLERGARKAPHRQTVRMLASAMQLADDETAALIAAARPGGANPSAPGPEPEPFHSEAPTVAGVPNRPFFGRRRLRPLVVVVASILVVAVVVGAVGLVPLFAGTPVASTPAPTRAASASTDIGQQLLVADTLADPSNAVFTRAQSGSSPASFSNGGTATYQWDFEYMYSAIVAHVLGPYPTNPDSAWLTASAALDQPLPHDFAVQVRGRITRSPEVSAFGLAFQAGPNQLYEFEVSPANQGYRLWLAQSQSPAAEGRSSWILPASQPNLVRLEISGDTVRALANGHELARAGPPELDSRQGGTVSLNWTMTGPPSEGASVEVRFAQFALYALP